MKLAGKSALVTGASRGIGRSIALALAKEGARVAVNYMGNQKAAEEVAERIITEGGEAFAIQADVGDYERVCMMVKEVTDRHGPVDILVNNAGVWRGGRLGKVKKSDWDWVIDTNLKGVFNCTQPVIDTMIKNRYGRIINITSIIGIMGFPGDTIYGSSKAGIIGFTKSLAKETAKFGITVNAVAPGIIATDMNKNLDEKIRQQLAERIPVGRLGDGEDVAEAVCFLASGAAYITGQVLVVDGGFTMG